MYAVIMATLIGYGPDDDARAALALAQANAAKPAPKKEQPKLPAKIKDNDKAKRQAVDKNCAIVFFVNTEVRTDDLTGVFVAAYLDEYQGDDTPRVVVAVPDGEGGLVYNKVGGHWYLPPNADGKAIEAMAAAQAQAARRTVSRPAVPFPSSRAEPQLARPEGSPWLPVGDQEYVRSLWPDGVELPKTLKFYKLRPASQRVDAYVPGDGRGRRFLPITMGGLRINENANRDFPWINSGGMDFANKGTWRNATGMALPENSKIKTWLAPMRVSTQYEIAMHWQFPTGTKMFDVLIRKNVDGSEHIFNVRRRVKNDDGWDDGASFMPDVPLGDVKVSHDLGSRRSREVLGIDRIAYRVATVKVDKKAKFKESNVAMNDEGHFFPPGFKGTGLTCNKCHSGAVHESQVYGGPLLRGKDTVFSWYPVNPSFVIDGESLESSIFARVNTPPPDQRWPIEYLGIINRNYGE